MITVDVTEEQAEVFAMITRCISTKDPGLLQRLLGWGDKEEPTPRTALNSAARYILTQHGETHGSFGGEVGILEITISYKVKPDKTTT